MTTTAGTSITMPFDPRGDEREVSLAVQRARALIIANQENYLAAAELHVQFKRRRDQAFEYLDPQCKAAAAAHKAAVKTRDTVVRMYEEPCEIIGRKMSEYQAEQNRIAERKRREALEAARKEEEDRRLAMAVEAERMGDREGAAEILERPVTPPPIVMPKEAPKPDGVSYMKLWKFRILDENLVPRQFCTPDEKKLGAYVRSMKEAACVPGVDVYCELSQPIRR